MEGSARGGHRCRSPPRPTQGSHHLPMGHAQDTRETLFGTRRTRRLGRRVCFRKGCGRVFVARAWNQRYCQDAACLREVRRWQARKRQQRQRESAEGKRRHREAERRRRRRAKTRRSKTMSSSESPENVAARGHAAEGKCTCDRPGCWAPPRASIRAPARYCGDECRDAVRRVRDRERKWLVRGTFAGRFKRRLEYAATRAAAARDRSRSPPSKLTLG
jgi:hypothetical protein